MPALRLVALLKHRLDHVLAGGDALQQGFARRLVKDQRAAGRQFAFENGVFHFLDVDSFAAQFVQHIGQHADAVVVTNDAAHTGMQLSRVDGVGRLAGVGRSAQCGQDLYGQQRGLVQEG